MSYVVYSGHIVSFFFVGSRMESHKHVITSPAFTTFSRFAVTLTEYAKNNYELIS